MNKLEGLLEFALEVARLGGDVLLNHFGSVGPEDTTEKGKSDWVSTADLASEKAIVEAILERFPDHAVLTEETNPAPANTAARYRWIIDPLDGTTNFIRGMPWWAVSVAVEHRAAPGRTWGEIVAGAVNIPLRGEIFSAAAGRGAFRNGAPLRIGTGRPMRDCLLATGFPFRSRTIAKQYMALFADLFARCADVRRAGAVAIDLCYVAAGVFDGFWEAGLAPWDIAAGSLIIREAGGKVGDFQGGGEYLSTGDVTAGHPVTYDELVAVVRRYFPQPSRVTTGVGAG